MEVEDHQLVRAVSDRAGAAISDGVKPDERMCENRRERFAQTHARAGVTAFVCFNHPRIASLLGRFLDEDDEQYRGDHDNQRRDAKEPMPVALCDDKDSDRESGENDRR